MNIIVHNCLRKKTYSIYIHIYIYSDYFKCGSFRERERKRTFTADLFIFVISLKSNYHNIHQTQLNYAQHTTYKNA